MKKRESAHPESTESVKEVKDITKLPVDKSDTETESIAKIKKVKKHKQITFKETEKILSATTHAVKPTDVENVTEMSPIEDSSRKEFPTNLAQQYSEALSTLEITHVDQDISPQTADKHVSSQTAITQEQTVCQEKEGETHPFSMKPVTAESTLNMLEAYETSQRQSHEVPVTFDKEFIPKTSTAEKNISEQEHLVVQEVHIQQSSSQLTEVETSKSVADSSWLPETAKVVSEVIPSQKEDQLEQFQKTLKTGSLVNTPILNAEPFIQNNVVQMNENIVKENVVIDVHPHSALIQEETLLQEKEGQHTKHSTTFESASKTFSELEALQIMEQNVENNPSEFDASFRPNTSNATKNIIPQEGLIVQQVNADDKTSDIIKQNIINSQAKVSVNELQATEVSEIQVSNKEKVMNEFELPGGVKISGTFTTNESINVEEQYPKLSEETLVTKKPQTAQPKMKIDTNESVIVEEVLPEVKPEKHLPEAFVPTEVATEKVIPQKSLTQSEIVAPEQEGDYSPGRLPPSQSANVEFTTGQSITIEQTQIQEKELILEKEKSPEKMNVSLDLILSEGVYVTSVDSQQAQTDMTKEELNKQKANVDYISKESIITQSVIPAESENLYEGAPQPNTLKAQTNISCLDIGSHLEVNVQETEDQFVPESKPLQVLANVNIKPNEYVNISETLSSDTVDVFSDKIKFKTDKATLDIISTEAKNVTELTIGESESKFITEQPTTQTVDAGLTKPQQEIEVSEMHILESEKSLKQFEIPESHKSKSVITHMLTTGITEQTNITSETAELKLGSEDICTAEISQNYQTETIISDTIPLENTSTVEQIKPDTKEAVVTLSEIQGLNVSEIILNQKEQDYNPKLTPSGQQAVVNIDGQTIASQSIADSQISTDNLKIPQVEKLQANTQQDVLESVEISQCNAAEKEKEYIIDDVNKKNAIIDLTGTHVGANISQVLINEKEQNLIEDAKPTEITALPNIVMQDVVVQSEIETVVHADNIEQTELLTGRAKKYTRPQDELIVTETNVVEVEKTLAPDIFPNSKQVNVEILPDQGISVTEVTANQKEERLDVSVPDTTQANVNISENLVAINEVIIPSDQPQQYQKQDAHKFNASEHHDVLHSLVQTCFTPGEKEGEKMADVQPDLKQVDVTYLESQSINVLEIKSNETENTLPDTVMPEGTLGNVSIIPHTIAIKQETLSENSLGPLTDFDHKTGNAVSNFEPLQSLVTSEMLPSESESALIEVKPSENFAVKDIEIGEGVSITSVTPAYKESTLDKDSVDYRNALINVLPKDELQVNETFTQYSTKNIEESEHPTGSAVKSHIEQQALTNIETVIGESEQILGKKELPSLQNVAVEFEKATATQISEVTASEKETQREATEKVENKTANVNVDVQFVAETTEAIVNDNVTKVPTETPQGVNAQLEQIPLESISLTQSQVHDSEKPFEDTPVDKKAAAVVFEEGVSVSITEINTEEKEHTFDTPVTEANKKVNVDFEKQEAPTSLIVTSQEALKDLSVTKPQDNYAFGDYVPINSLLVEETITHESERPSYQEPVEGKVGNIIINEEQGIMIESVLPHEREDKFSEKSLDLTMANLVMNDFNEVPISTLTEAIDNVTDFKQKKPEHSLAEGSTIPHSGVINLEQVAGEKEKELEGSAKPTSVTASVDFEHSVGIITEESVVAQKEDALEQLKYPQEKNAQPSIDNFHKIAEIIATETSEHLSKIVTNIPEGKMATPLDTTLIPLVISENISEEKEILFTDKFKPITSTAQSSLEEGKKVINIEEITSQEKETSFTSTDKFDDHKASIDIEPVNVPQITEIFSQTSVKETSESEIKNVNATIKHPTFDEVIQSVPDIMEKEDVFEGSIDRTSQVAQGTVEEIKVPSLSETIAAERESKLLISKKPEEALALKSLTSNISTETSEIMSVMNVEALKTEGYTFAESTASQDVLQSIKVNQQIAVESIQEILGEVKPSQTSAESKIDVMTHVNISEVKSEINPVNLEEFKFQSTTAESSVNNLESLETSEVFPSEGIVNLSEEDKTMSVKAEFLQDTHKVLICSQQITGERETLFDGQPTVDKKIAETVIDQITPLSVTEVHDEQAVTSDEGEVKPVTKTANKDLITSLPVALQTQIKTEESINKIKTVLPLKELAETTQSNFESIIVTTDQVQEKEKSFSETPVTTEKADFSLLPKSHLIITETKSTETEQPILKKEPFKSNVDVTLLPQYAQEITEVKSHQGIEPLKQEETNLTEANIEQVPVNPLEVSEIITNESERHLKRDDVPSFTSVEKSIEQPRQTAVTSETFTSQVETELKEEKINVTKANSFIDDLKGIEKFQPTAFELVENLNIKQEGLKMANIKTSSRESVLSTDTFLHGSTDVLPKDEAEPKTANILLILNEGLKVTETNIEGTTGKRVTELTAKENIAEKSLQTMSVGLHEETLILERPELLKDESQKTSFAKKDISGLEKHGLLVTEQKSTGNLKDIEPLLEKPKSKTVNVLLDISPSLQISEVQLHELAGKFYMFIIITTVVGMNERTFTAHHITPTNHTTRYTYANKIHTLPKITIIN